MKKIYSIILLGLMLFGINSNISAQSTLASWDFTLDETTDPVTVSPGAAGNISVDNYGTHPLESAATEANITVTPLTKGQGLLDAIAANPIPPTTTTAKWIYAAWGALGFDVTIADGIDTSTWLDDEVWVNTRVAEDKYITFSVAPNAGYKISYTQIPAHMIRSFSASSPVRVCYQYKIEGENDYVTIATKSPGSTNSGGRTITSMDLSSIADLQNQGKKVTFRIVFYNLSATGAGAAGFYRSSLSVTGTVSEDIGSEPDVIAYWDFTNSTNTASFGPNALAPTANANAVTVVPLTRSAAIDATTTGTTSVWGVKDLSSTNLASYTKGDMDSRYADMINDAKYVTFSITPNTGTILSLSGIDAFIARASGSSVRMRMEYKIGDGTFTVFGIRSGDTTEDLPLSNGSSGVTSKGIDFSEAAALQDIAAGTTITFRIVYILNETSGAEAAWAGFYNTNFIIRGSLTHTLALTSSNDAQGSVSSNYSGDMNAIPNGTDIEVSATAEPGFIFKQWSDGNTDNPRTITITETTSLTASFEVNTTTGIDNATTDKGVIISEIYYNLTGKQVSAGTKGLVLKKITYENGSVEVVKQILD